MLLLSPLTNVDAVNTTGLCSRYDMNDIIEEEFVLLILVTLIITSCVHHFCYMAYL
jgi:hypothetical protein